MKTPGCISGPAIIDLRVHRIRRPLPAQDRTVALEPQRVLRNTYWLLAISMLPTVAGALVGMSLNFIALVKAAPIMTPLIMFGVMLG